MKKFAVFTNYGNWDVDSIGFIGFVDVDNQASPSEVIASAVSAFHADQLTRPLDPTEVKLCEPHIEAISKVYEEYEVNLYIDPDFTHFGICNVDKASDLLCGVIEVI